MTRPCTYIFAATLAASLAAATAQAQTTLPKLTTTATQGIALGQLLGATDLGPLPVSEPLTIRMGMQIRNKEALLAYVKSVNDPKSASYGQTLTPAQFAATYGPTPAQAGAVIGFLQSAGFTNISIEE